MYRLNSHSNNHCVSQVNATESHVEPNDASSLELVASDSNHACSSIATDASSTLHKLPQYLFSGYGCSSDLEAISEGCDDIFLQGYATKCGYNLTEDFLSIMNKHKLNFMSRVDPILSNLPHSFSFFLKESKEENKNIISIMNRAGSSFSKNASDFRSKCISVLRYNIIPITIKSIFDSKVIDGDYERKMTYPEMEQLFLHFVSTLEKLVMVKIMGCWRDFCNDKSIASLIVDTDYSNPFILSHNSDETSITDVTYSSAFTDKFGDYVSLIAVAKIDEMMGPFIDKCSDVLKKDVRYKSQCVFNRGGCFDNYLKDLRNEFKFLVNEEFDKKIIEEKIKDKLSNFLNDVLILDKGCSVETNRLSVFDKIIDHTHDLLVNTVNDELHKVIRFFQEGTKLGLNISHEDICKIFSVKHKFSVKSKKLIKNKFCLMLEEGYKFPDGTAISIVDWNSISKKLLPIAQETIKPLIDGEYKELYEILSNANVIEDICVFDGSSAGTRKATSEEIDKVLKISIDKLHLKNINLYIRIWGELIDGKKIKLSKDVGHVSVPTVDGGDSLVAATSVQNKPSVQSEPLVQSKSLVQVESSVIVPMPEGLFNKRDEIINMWGLNLYPDDYELISVIKKRFSIQINNHLTELFFRMFKDEIALPSGNVLRDSHWDLISSELHEVSKKSLESIIENQRLEFDRSLSKSRIIDVSVDNDVSSVAEDSAEKIEFMTCTDRLIAIRKVTADEKKELMVHAEEIIEKTLAGSIRESWSVVVTRFLTSCSGYGYKAKYKDICTVVTEGSWGVKLRYIDNVSILNARRKFSSDMKSALFEKFSSMLRNKHEFDDGSFIAPVAWFRTSRKLIPIARNEVKNIVEDEKEMLKEIVSKARVMVDLTSDREITVEESSMALEKIMELVCGTLRILFRTTWRDVIASLGSNSVDINDCATTSSEVCSIGEASASSVNEVDLKECADNKDNISKSGDEDDVSKIKLCYEDDISVFNIKRKISSEICSNVNDKFSEILREWCRTEGHNIISSYPWRKVSKKLLPIVEKEISATMEREYTKIADKLLELHVDISSPDDYSTVRITRKLTSEERLVIMDDITKSVRRNIAPNLSRSWNKFIKKLPLVSLSNLAEEDKLQLDYIKFEFIGSLGLIVSEVIGSLSSDLDPSNLDDMEYKICSVVFERSHNLFKEGGFLKRVKSLLSIAKVVDLSGNSNHIDDKYKKIMIKELMNQIDSDGVCLVRKRIGNFNSKSPTMPVLRPAELPVDDRDCDTHHGERKTDVTTDSSDLKCNDHSYAKKFCLEGMVV